MRTVVVFDELADVTPAMWDHLLDRVRRPMTLDTFFRLQAADAAQRLDTFEQQLQRRRIRAEHEAGELARRLAKWEAVEAASPYRSTGVH